MKKILTEGIMNETKVYEVSNNGKYANLIVVDSGNVIVVFTLCIEDLHIFQYTVTDNYCYANRKYIDALIEKATLKYANGYTLMKRNRA